MSAFDFLDEADVDHRFDAAFDAAVQFEPVAPQDEHAALVGRSTFFELGLLMAEGLAGGAIDFERADESPRVVRMDVRRGDGIDLRESLVERGLADFGELVFDLLAQLPVGGRAVEQAAEQTLEIERRAADEEDLFAAGVDLGHRGGGRFDVLGDAVLVGRLDDVEQMMRHGGAVCGRRLGGADVHAAIDRHRVERDDFGVESLGERDADACLADGGGAGQKPTIREPIANCVAHLVALHPSAKASLAAWLEAA